MMIVLLEYLRRIQLLVPCTVLAYFSFNACIGSGRKWPLRLP